LVSTTSLAKPKTNQYKLGARVYQRLWYHKHKDIIRAKLRERYKNDKAFYDRLRSQSKKSRDKLRDKINDKARKKYAEDLAFRMKRHKSHTETYWLRREKVKSEVFEQLGNKCKVCGENDPLCLECHHLNGTNSKHKLGITDNLEKWRLYLSQINDLALLCANCHRKLHGNNNLG